MGRKHWKFYVLLEMLCRGDIRTPAGRIRRWIDSQAFSYGLRRDLAVPYQMIPPKVPLTIRPLLKSDLPALFGTPPRSAEERYFLMGRREFIRQYSSGGYVAVARGDTPCYMQWLITPADNEKVREYFGGFFPWLAVDEVLLEQSYTVEGFRGLGIMSYAMSKIAEIGRSGGARWALTFVSPDNIPALRGSMSAGFLPHLIRRERWRWFHRQISFHALAKSALVSPCRRFISLAS